MKMKITKKKLMFEEANINANSDKCMNASIIIVVIIALFLNLSNTKLIYAVENNEYEDYSYLVTTPGYIEVTEDEFIENPINNTRTTYNTLPSNYGNNNKNVYNQGTSPTCWAFAGTSLFEYIVDKESNTSATSFSVEHMIEKTSIVGNCGFVATTKAGGNATMVATYFVSGYGPVLAENYPWGDNYNLIENYDFGKAEYRATDIRYIASNRNEDGTLDGNTNSIIKEAVYNNGAVYCSIYSDGRTQSSNSNYLGSDNCSYYNYDVSGTNHGVLIVGWDDTWSKTNFKTEPNSDGAWLVRNSWGANVGDNGYYWVSYEDISLSPRITICGYEKMDEYQKIYNLDESGRSSDYISTYPQEGYINVFNIERNEKLTTVTFFESSLTATYQIYYVPINSDGTPNVSEKIALSDEESIPYSGYHTVRLNKNIELPGGSKCGIMVYIKDNVRARIGIEKTTSLTTATLNAGESFRYINNSAIKDFTDVNSSTYGNFSIKLITEEIGTPINECLVNDVGNKIYTGTGITPELTITHNGTQLKEGIDYILSYENNINAGTATINVTGIGDYKGETEKSFVIEQADIDLCEVSEIGTQCYTGAVLMPPFTVTYNSITLTPPTDYVTAHLNCSVVGKATIIIIGAGNFKGTRTINFNITNDLAYAEIEYDSIQKYTGEQVSPELTVTMGDRILVQNTDYIVTISPREHINEGTYTLIIMGDGKYIGSQEITYTIVKD